MKGDLFSQPFEEEQPAPRPAPPGAPRPERRVRTVSELTTAVRDTLETAFGDVWVEGEISNCRIWNTGHAYFTLKDDGAQIRAVMFRSAVRYLKFKLEDGLHVVARGRLGVYEPKGEYQLQCEHMQPHGLGALQLAFEQLKKKLAAEGLFDQSRKRTLPALPRKIGIVTSLDGAALRDIIKVLRRRHPNAHLVIRPARVQGETAAAEVTRGLRAISRVEGVDVVILARGGGSIEDLWAFNEEVVARAIAACSVPVICAVGHEVDFTIADFVADLRAPTPSAAAELVVSAKDELSTTVTRLSHRLEAAVRVGVQRRRAAVNALANRRGLAGWPGRVMMRGRLAGELAFRMRRALAAGLQRHERTMQTLRRRLEARELTRSFAVLRGRLHAADAKLSGRDPASDRPWRGVRPCAQRPSRHAQPACRPGAGLRGLLERGPHADPARRGRAVGRRPHPRDARPRRDRLRRAEYTD